MDSELETRAFVPTHADLVASWVESPAELFWLAPGTPPPLTAEKVTAWTRSGDHPFLLFRSAEPTPLGYAELNFMPRDRRDLWIGHLIVPQARRGQGLGAALTRLLLRTAFARFNARSVSLVVFPENEPALQCYLKCGMVTAGFQRKVFVHHAGEHRMLKMKITARQFRRLHARRSGLRRETPARSALRRSR